jgi:hypothetical protein
MSNQDEVIALTLGLAVTARILPETWLPKDVREDLGVRRQRKWEC